MSMNCWPEYGFGLMLNDGESEAVLNAYCSKTEVECDDLYELADELGCNYYDDTFDGRSFTSKKGHDEWVTGLFFWAEHQPKAFEAAYPDMASCVQEFQDSIGMYLPDDFNYEEHIGIFQGTICC